jgi:hypothetical protein
MNKLQKITLVGIKSDLAGYRSYKKCYVCHCEKSHSGMTFIIYGILRVRELTKILPIH